ncbi:MAG: hypothetical protein A3G33_02215 [Omnitrophica bacterium RIFCSPLOWO2_12_FULL_44_17]|uniref:Prepilin-type N-terminal cleavage/methylation domain-containing protein n=1 Tax=Candidatus Danuiimicrobium aquiferis TaxID=1801832 RepID=A0A1G1L253_9BACT|nr:MAG: hypothetical protein A3B72_08735 [Omnitrophica bacterium RIFCSPHIGHO2_02_FULL_45_28]OGW90825.1 MAG: hypothetical protein A3E74_05645 [Omnitrophica bacterium RIFCSPHIGHO2_12_FULL_44_12]OGW99230.1 MAG: hypothetical protein A3G33_02215 [Omnitrophica bacterium RIFCSPLOWO2_12_FULL_44_17]OGX04700.1 MAG: hypothetical protein A3J12_00055 [Omnitrophica bacterium RIFCSPLOWO2_02_FULL_44_11]
MNKKRGFTLSEITITVAIVGVVTSVSVPSYLQARRNTNMEIVRQHMKQIGEKLIEILEKKGKFSCAANPTDPACETKWPLIGSFDPDEQAITASLSAIDNLCYTTADYSTNTPRTSYRFCSQPKSASCGVNAGNKRFCVHYDPQMSALFSPGIVGEVEMFDGLGTPMSLYMERPFEFVGSNNQWLDFARDMEMEAAGQLFWSYETRGYNVFENDPLAKMSWSSYIQMTEEQAKQLSAIDAYLRQQTPSITMIANLKSASEVNAKYMKSLWGQNPDSSDYAVHEGNQVYEIAFQFPRPTVYHLPAQGGVQEYLSQNSWVRGKCSTGSESQICYMI